MWGVKAKPSNQPTPQGTAGSPPQGTAGSPLQGTGGSPKPEVYSKQADRGVQKAVFHFGVDTVENKYANVLQLRWTRQHPEATFVFYLAFLAFVALVVLLNLYPVSQRQLNLSTSSVFDYHIKSIPSDNPYDLKTPIALKGVHQIKTAYDIFAWLYFIIAPPCQFGFPTSGSQLYRLELSLSKSALVQMDNVAYKSLVRQSLGRQGTWRIHDSNLESKLKFYPSNVGGTDIQKVLRELWDNKDIGSETTRLRLKMAFYSGNLGIWNELSYDFIRTGMGSFQLKTSFVPMTIIAADNLRALAPVILNFIYVAAFLALAVLQILTLRKRVSFQNIPLQMHFCREGADYLFLLLHFLLVIQLLYGMIYLAANGINDALKAIDIGKDEKLPFAVYPFGQGGLQIVGSLAITITFIKSLEHLANSNECLEWMILTTKDALTKSLVGLFYPFLIAWLGWSAANHIILGPKNSHFASFGTSLVTTFRMFFGQPIYPFLQSFSTHNSVSRASFLLLYFLQLITFIVIQVPFFAAITVNAYKAHEARSSCTHPENNAKLALKKFASNYLFFCAAESNKSQPYQILGGPNTYTDSDDDDGSSVGNSKLSKSSIWITTSLFWIFAIFMFTVGGLFSGHLAKHTSPLTKAQFPTHLLYPPPAYSPKDFSVKQSSLPQPTPTSIISFKDISAIDDIWNWLIWVVVRHQLCYPNTFDITTPSILPLPSLECQGRHVIPLSNPFVVMTVFLAKDSPNMDSLTKNSMWPVIRGAFPIDDHSSLLQNELNLHNLPEFSSVPSWVTLHSSDDHLNLYVHLGDYNETIAQLRAVQKLHLISYQCLKVSVNVFHFNGDVAAIELLRHDFKISPTGGISPLTKSVLIDRENAGNTIGILLGFGCTFFVLYCVTLYSSLTAKRMRPQMLSLMLDASLFISVVFVLNAFADYNKTFAQAGWFNTETPTGAVPHPVNIPGPNAQHLILPFTLGSSNQPFTVSPSTDHTDRLAGQILDFAASTESLQTMLVVIYLLILVRGLFAGGGNPLHGKISGIPSVLYAARWEIRFLCFFLTIIFVTHWLLWIVTFGIPLSQDIISPSISQTLLSQIMTISAKWNLKYNGNTDTTRVYFGFLIFIYDVVVVLLWQTILINVILAVVLRGVREIVLKEKSTEKVDDKFSRVIGVKKREPITIRANNEVTLYWKAFLKSVELQSSEEVSSEHHFIHLKDKFFTDFAKLPLFLRRVDPTTPEDRIVLMERTFVAQNITRIQQHLTDIILLNAKCYMMDTDRKTTKKILKDIQKSAKSKFEYIDVIEAKLAALTEEIENITDTINYEQAQGGFEVHSAWDSSTRAIREDAVKMTPEMLKKARKGVDDHTKKVRKWRHKVKHGQISAVQERDTRPSAARGDTDSESEEEQSFQRKKGVKGKLVGAAFAPEAIGEGFDNAGGRGKVVTFDGDKKDGEWSSIRRKFDFGEEEEDSDDFGHGESEEQMQVIEVARQDTLRRRKRIKEQRNYDFDEFQNAQSDEDDEMESNIGNRRRVTVVKQQGDALTPPPARQKRSTAPRSRIKSPTIQPKPV